MRTLFTATLALFITRSQGFLVPEKRRIQYQQSKGEVFNRFQATTKWHPLQTQVLRTSVDDDSDGGGDDGTRKRLTTSRAGGRGRKPPVKQDTNPKKKLPQFPGWLGAFTLGMLLLWVFSGNGNNDFYYYSYSSSVYETRSLNSEGQIETKRKESSDFRSNIPGLREKDTESAKEILRENQRLLERQEDEFFDAFRDATSVRAMENMLDDWFE